MLTEDLRVAKGNETKERIIYVAMVLISTNGVDGLSAKKIADELKISKSNIFHHFGSIDLLLETIFKSIVENLTDAISLYEGKDLESFLHYLGEGVSTLQPEERLAYAVLLNFYNTCLHNDAYNKILLTSRDKMVESIANQLEKYSSLEREALLNISQMMVMTLDGFGLSYLLNPEDERLEACWILQVKAWKLLL